MFRISKKAENYRTQFYENYDITNWFSMFSMYVWERLKFYHEGSKFSSKVDEPLFTHDLIQGISQIIKEDKIPIPVRLFHSRKESANGNDIEIIVQIQKDKNIIFPCQAKRLYVENANATYKQLNYKEGEQKQKLIKYAKSINGFPLYLLYNYSEHNFDTKYLFSEKELYGCTLLSAQYLDENPNLKLIVSKLHPPAKPLISILKFRDILSLNRVWGVLKSEHGAEPWSDEEILKDDRWNEFGPPSYLPTRFVSSTDWEKVFTKQTSQIVANQLFNPKFRIILTHDVIDLNTRKIS